MNLVGLSAYYHDSAACVTVSGQIKSALQEERFSRKKFDASFPAESLKAALAMEQLSLSDVDALIYYEKPWTHFERILDGVMAVAPAGLPNFLRAMPPWLHHKFNMRHTLSKELKKNFPQQNNPPILFSAHHLSHAASAFFPSPFEDAAVLCLDGVGEWATTTAWHGRDHKLHPLWQIRYPHSLGLLYSAFTAYCGFKVNSGEYKLMGAAPYGEPRFQKIIEENLIDIKNDGSFRLNTKFFGFLTQSKMYNHLWKNLFGEPPRIPETPLRAFDFDMAASIQVVTEKIILRLAKTVRDQTKSRHLCMAGGVALNCVATGKISDLGLFDEIWVQPAAGDSGGAIGAALAAWHIHFGKPRITQYPDAMVDARLGDQFTDHEIQIALQNHGLKFKRFERADLMSACADLLAEQKALGWFQGPMEFGPRALGSRSILGDPRDPEMRKRLNLKIKFRESFRPFAPIVQSEEAPLIFALQQESPYMLIVSKVQKARQKDFPAITHADGSARVQTVSRKSNELMWGLLENFKTKTGSAVLINTSFNVRGEPIVRTPEEAIACFLNTHIDALCMGPFLVVKDQIMASTQSTIWRNQFELD